jgi:hypothetical protein
MVRMLKQVLASTGARRSSIFKKSSTTMKQVNYPRIITTTTDNNYTSFNDCLIVLTLCLHYTIKLNPPFRSVLDLTIIC